MSSTRSVPASAPRGLPNPQLRRCGPAVSATVLLLALCTGSATLCGQIPVLAGIAPTQSLTGEVGVLITATGSGFTAQSTVFWGAVPLPTSFSNATTLTAVAGAILIVNGASVPVTVTTPGVGGGTSSPQTFTVLNRIPDLTFEAPRTLPVGGGGAMITVRGGHFNAQTTIRWNGIPLQSIVGGPFERTCQVPANLLAFAGQGIVTASNPAPGGGVSSGIAVEVTNVPPVRIMPLGDSITESVTPQVSYRYWLWKDLWEAGYSVDFVGTQSGVFAGAPALTDYDQDHEGHTGLRADEVASNIVTWATQQTPDIALVHLGTNDLLQGQTIASTVTDLGAVIAGLRVANPNVTVILAQIIPGAPAALANNVGNLNAQLPFLAASLTSAMSPVLVVDQFSGFNVGAHTYDGVHPNPTGERLISDDWLRKLASQLGPFRLLVTNRSGPTSAEIWLLGGPAGHQYFWTVTPNLANAQGGLGTGWFGGLHITLTELLAAYILGIPPFLGVLDGEGSSITVFPPGTLVPLNGVTIYSVAHAIDPFTGLFGPPSNTLAYTIH